MKARGETRINIGTDETRYRRETEEMPGLLKISQDKGRSTKGS